MSGPSHYEDRSYLILLNEENREREEEEIEDEKELKDFFKDYEAGKENDKEEKYATMEDLEQFLAV